MLLWIDANAFASRLRVFPKALEELYHICENQPYRAMFWSRFPTRPQTLTAHEHSWTLTPCCQTRSVGLTRAHCIIEPRAGHRRKGLVAPIVALLPSCGQLGGGKGSTFFTVYSALSPQKKQPGVIKKRHDWKALEELYDISENSQTLRAYEHPCTLTACCQTRWMRLTRSHCIAKPRSGHRRKGLVDPSQPSKIKTYFESSTTYANDM